MKKYIVFLMIFINFFYSYAKNKFYDIKLESDFYLEEVSLTDALSVLSKEYHISIIADESAKNLILDINFSKGTTVDEIINSIVSTNNLKQKEVGNSIILSKKIKTIDGEVTFAGKVLINGYNNGIEGVKVTILKSFLSPIYTMHGGNFVINDISPGIYIVKFEKDGYLPLGEIINLESSSINMTFNLEKNNSIKINKQPEDKVITKSEATIIDGEKYYTERIKLFKMPPEEIKEILESTYVGLLRVTPVTKISSVILFGKKEVVDAAKKIIKDLDSDLKQVRVSSQILDVSDNLFEELGFDWVYSNNGEISDAKGVNGSLLKNAVIDGIGSNFSSGIGLIRQFNGGKDVLSIGMHILESNQDLVISAIPSILIADGEEGEFKIAEEVIVGEEKDENSETSKTTYTPLFREAGIILKVQPFIQDNDSIVLKVKIEVSNFKLKKAESTEETGTYNAEGGSKIGRSIETTVKIKNGETIFIGGLKRAIVHNLESKVPILGNIPILGNLFKKRSIKNEATDIYIKLKVDIPENSNEEFDNMEIHKNYNKIKNKRIY
ncbi:MAG: general secretion pathway protein GspD [Fusobacteriaceae bacterium]|nr:general secretion pathway protein GspD [Fusobacteriaceae bacterium]